MTVSADTPLIGPAQGSAAQLVAYAKGGNRPAEIAAYAAEVYRVSPQAGLDPLLVCAAACDETGTFTNRWWTERLNAGSLGVTGDPAQNEASPTFDDGATAARGHVAHLLLYATGRIDAGGLTPSDDPRYSAYLAAYGPVARARTLADLGSAYAANPNYGAQIAGHANAILATKGDTPVPAKEIGHVPYPPALRIHTDGIPGQNCYDSPIDRQGNIAASFTHTPVGRLGKPDDRAKPEADATTWDGTVGYFTHDPNCLGLTDAIIGGPTDGEYDGTIVEIIDPAAPLSPYANGRVGEVTAPYGDGAIFIAENGIEPAVNAYARSVELSDGGDPTVDRVLKGPQIETYCLYIAHVHAEEIGQTADTLRLRCYHCETGSSHQGCAGQGMWAIADETMARIGEIMSAYQFNTPLSYPLLITYPPGYHGPKVPTPEEYWAAKQPQPTPTPAPNPTPTPPPAPKPVYAKPIPPPDFKGIDVLDTSQKAWVATKHTYRTVTAAPRLRTANRNASRVGPDIAAGLTFSAPWQVHGGGFIKGDKRPDNETYLVTERGSRIPAVLCEVVT